MNTPQVYANLLSGQSTFEFGGTTYAKTSVTSECKGFAKSTGRITTYQASLSLQDILENAAFKNSGIDGFLGRVPASSTMSATTKLLPMRNLLMIVNHEQLDSTNACRKA